MKNTLNSNKKEDSFLQKEIIDTFFKKSVQGVSQKSRPRLSKKISIFIASLLLLTLVLSAIIIILYMKRLPAYDREAKLSNFFYRESIIKNGRINRTDIEEIYFDGDAKEKSSFLKNSIKLVNFGEYGRASLIMEFREHLDLNEKGILIFARATHGRKKIRLVLTDSENRFYESPEVSFSSDWNLKHIYLSKTDDFNLKRIKALKVEFGSHTTGNEENATIYLKEITVRAVK